MFHSYIRDNCGNKAINIVIEDILKRLLLYYNVLRDTDTYRDFEDDHDLIIDSIKNKDTRKAKKAIEKHRGRVLEKVLRYIKQFEMP